MDVFLAVLAIIVVTGALVALDEVCVVLSGAVRNVQDISRQSRCPVATAFEFLLCLLVTVCRILQNVSWAGPP